MVFDGPPGETHADVFAKHGTMVSCGIIPKTSDATCVNITESAPTDLCDLCLRSMKVDKSTGCADRMFHERDADVSQTPHVVRAGLR